MFKGCLKVVSGRTLAEQPQLKPLFCKMQGTMQRFCKSRNSNTCRSLKAAARRGRLQVLQSLAAATSLQFSSAIIFLCSFQTTYLSTKNVFLKSLLYHKQTFQNFFRRTSLSIHTSPIIQVLQCLFLSSLSMVFLVSDEQLRHREKICDMPKDQGYIH